jgi:DNA-binding XRE family transcriptional regulator
VARTGWPDDVQELREEIELTREQLGETVERLAAKTDVKARAQDKGAELTCRVRGKASQARTQAAASAGKARDRLASTTGATGQTVVSLGTAAREQLSGRVAAVGAPVWEATPEPVRHAVTTAGGHARLRRLPLAAAAGALVFCVVIRWRRRR